MANDVIVKLANMVMNKEVLKQHDLTVLIVKAILLTNRKEKLELLEVLEKTMNSGTGIEPVRIEIPIIIDMVKKIF